MTRACNEYLVQTGELCWHSSCPTDRCRPESPKKEVPDEPLAINQQILEITGKASFGANCFVPTYVAPNRYPLGDDEHRLIVCETWK